MDAGVTGTAGTTPCTSGGTAAAAAATTRTTTPGGGSTTAATRIAGDARAGDGLDLCGCRLGQDRGARDLTLEPRKVNMHWKD